MPATVISSAATAGFSPPSFHRSSIPSRNPLKILAMAPQKKVNRYDKGWKKQWYGAGIFTEGSEEVSFDVVKKIEERKVLSGVEKAGLLSKAEQLGFTLSSIEKLGFFSKAEDLGLLSLLEKAASLSPSALASFSLPLLAAALAVVLLIPDDSPALVTAQTVVAALLAVAGVGSFVGSVLLGGLQELD
ncbi:hypothetical protein KSP39_PZI006236 [Platanthera zijinensis]|uniref:Uncharacterized protein n=1 Tax=Platanthera zijinensis TaxID=2320716 RepID=A0AAP0BSD5_9ASPA